MRYEDLVLHPKETILALAEHVTDEKVRDFEVNAEKETLRDAESAKAKVRWSQHFKFSCLDSRHVLSVILMFRNKVGQLSQTWSLFAEEITRPRGREQEILKQRY